MTEFIWQHSSFSPICFPEFPTAIYLLNMRDFPPLWKLQIVVKVNELIFSFNIYFMGRRRKHDCSCTSFHCKVWFLNQNDKDTVLCMILGIIGTKKWALLINRPWLIIIKCGAHISVHFNNSCRRLTMPPEIWTLRGLDFSKQCHNK